MKIKNEKTLKTKRLILREWRDVDIQDFVAMGRDPQVMRFFLSCGVKKDLEISRSSDLEP